MYTNPIFIIRIRCVKERESVDRLIAQFNTTDLPIRGGEQIIMEPVSRYSKYDSTMLVNGMSIFGKAISKARSKKLGMPRVDGRCSNNHECNYNDGTDTTIQTNELNQPPIGLWQVLYEHIPPAPLYAPLERMSVKTIGGVSLRTLTTRISEFMTRNHIFCAYNLAGRIDCSRGVAVTAAIAAVHPGYRSRGSTSSVGSMRTSSTTNSDSVLKFIVQLWRENEDDNGGVIVEVQRRRGCCVSMRETRTQLHKFLARNGCHHSLVSR